MDDYFYQNNYEEPSYYAPSYVPIYYQTYETRGKGKGGGKGGRMKGFGQKFRSNMKKAYDDMQYYGDYAMQGLYDMGKSAKKGFDKFNQQTTKKLKGMCKYNF